MKIGEFFKAQGLEVNKTTGRIEKEFSKTEREKELEKMGYGPDGEVLDQSKVENYDPLSRSSFEDQDDVEIEREHQKLLDDFSNQESLENFIKTYEEVQNENIGGFENEDILSDSIKKTSEREEREYEKKKAKLPEYSEFEIKSFKDALSRRLDRREVKFADGQKMSEEQVRKLINEFKTEVPDEFVKMIDRRLISENFQWEEENFKDKKIMVSYFPDKQNPSIKYILRNTKGVEPQIINKVFVDSSVNKNKEVIRDKKKCLLVFCSIPMKRKKSTESKENKKSNKRFAPTEA